MKKRTALCWTIAVALLLGVAGVQYAGNMGFRLNFNMPGGPGPRSLDGTCALALPYCQKTTITTAEDLLIDVPNAVGVGFLNKGNNLGVRYTGAAGTPPDFTLNPGEGYFVTVTAQTDYLMAGTHDPLLTLSFSSGGLDGTCLTAFPYHSTLVFASEAQQDIGFPTVTGIGFLNKLNNLGVRYTGVAGTPPDFMLIPGVSYFVTVTADVAGYTPPHY